MPLFSRRAEPLPATTYGYAPPHEATANGWICSSRNCGRAGDSVPRRWPFACPQCGAPADPRFNEPWAHYAQGPWLQHMIKTDPYGGSIWQSKLLAWRYKDALQARDSERIHEASRDSRSYVENQLRADRSFDPGEVLFEIVWSAVEHGQMDVAAQELAFWREHLVTDGIEMTSSLRTACHRLLQCQLQFLEEPLARNQPASSTIRAQALELGDFLDNVHNNLANNLASRVQRLRLGSA